MNLEKKRWLGKTPGEASNHPQGAYSIVSTGHQSYFAKVLNEFIQFDNIDWSLIKNENFHSGFVHVYCNDRVARQ